ncbi:Neutral/alkaline nonlysosomal ceramidase [Lactifluus volemus]|nr:Neutral/alkaline nonlysosomal ceramidase [Lactifluus volemus]
MPPTLFFLSPGQLEVLLKMRTAPIRAWLYAAGFLASRISLVTSATQANTNDYLLGLGIADITGPVVETNIMGYAMLSQTDKGLHMRQRSRAFIIAEALNSTNRVVFINADIAFGDTGIRRSVINHLKELYQGLYDETNVVLSSTHQHAGVGGYTENLLPQITSLGYVRETAEAIVQGTLRAVQRAHKNLAPGSLALGNATVADGNINRSPSAYLANPSEERGGYNSDQDKTLTLLRFHDSQGNKIGFLSFYAVHGTSLYHNNTLISSDNKGMAAYLYESLVEPNAMPGNTTFVAGFAQSNVGDSSPNTLGAFCESPGKAWDGMPCEFYSSTCGGTSEDCHGRGPGFRVSDFESNRIIAQLQVDGARSLMNSNSLQSVTGPVRSVHTYLNMSFHSFVLPNGTTVQTCPPALGYAFGGGTTDGPGLFDFVQSDNSSKPQNPFWEIVKGAVTPLPDNAQIACHYPKPILLNTGYAHLPYEWSPHTVEIQMLRVGNIVLVVIPGELTTMAGRRMRYKRRSGSLIEDGIIGDDAYVVIAGPANTYAHYVTTIEEYSMQRYEGASTLFGPYTLDAYIDKYTSLVSYLANNATNGLLSPPHSDAAPPDLSSKQISLRTPVIFDSPPIGHNFGDTMKDNNLRLEDTFMAVEKVINDSWSQVRTDSHPSTIYRWTRTNIILGTSTVNLSWCRCLTDHSAKGGTYRLVYFGDSKSITGQTTAFTGTSSSFSVSEP